jgi:hypothetical protein
MYWDRHDSMITVGSSKLRLKYGGFVFKHISSGSFNEEGCSHSGDEGTNNPC